MFSKGEVCHVNVSYTQMHFAKHAVRQIAQRYITKSPTPSPPPPKCCTFILSTQSLIVILFGFLTTLHWKCVNLYSRFIFRIAAVKIIKHFFFFFFLNRCHSQRHGLCIVYRLWQAFSLVELNFCMVHQVIAKVIGLCLGINQ